MFGNDGNALAVAAALGRQGYNVLLLHRTNHLDSLLGRMSHKRTGVLHCKKERKAEMCKKSLNTSFVLSCARARDAIDRYRLRRRAGELLFRNWPGRSMAPAPCCVWSMSASLAARERGSRRLALIAGCLTTAPDARFDLEGSSSSSSSKDRAARTTLRAGP